MQNPARRKLTKEFLDAFLKQILEHERNPLKCSISLIDASAFLGQQKKHFKRLIDADFRKDKKPTGFTRDVDFTYLPSIDCQNREQKELFMTVDTFKRAASKSKSEVGDQVREYVWLIEKAFRTFFGSRANEKYERHPFEEVKAESGNLQVP